MKKFLSILLVAMLIISMIPATVFAADTQIEFAMSPNGSATHADGTSKTTYKETVNGYTLELTNVSNFYTGARDAKGNGCIKLGASSKTGGFTFKAPDDVTSVVIYIAKYKSNTTKITVNGTAYTLTKNSNDGAYDEITVDTSTNKTVTLTTVSGGYRAMVNTIKYVIPAAEGACEHPNTTTTTVAANCTENGSTTVTCDDCNAVVSTEKIPATGHQNLTEQEAAVEGDCKTEGKTAISICEDCGETLGGESTGLGDHNYVNGTCTVCGESEPAAIFEFGDNGAAGHKETTAAKTTYTETVGNYTLSLTSTAKMYLDCFDAKGNSCIKLGTGSEAGNLSFEVPEEVTSVVIYIAKYKANATKVDINGTTYTLTKNSNDGEYDAIEVDTTEATTVTLTTVSGGYRAMVNAIEFCVTAPSVFEDEQGNGYDTVAEAIEAGVTVLKAVDEATEMPFDITVDGKRYIGLEGEDDFYSYYTLELKVSGVALRASEAGIYYYAQAVCDDALAGAVDSYGIVLSANDMPTKDALDAADNAATQTLTTDKALPNGKDDKFNSGSVFNILKDGLEVADNQGRGVAVIYAVVYLEIDGEYVISTQEIKLSLKGVLELINTRLGVNLTLDKEQNNELYNFYQKWAVEKEVINGWNLDKIAALTLMQ